MSDVAELVDALTLEEKVILLCGLDAWTIGGCDRLGIPSWTVSDGPVGIRGRGMTPTACFPSASAVAATFDTVAARDLGRGIAEEARAKRIVLALGPTVNIHRHPLGGRHFECYSEDPLLTTRTGVAYVEGVQEEPDEGSRVGACMKHYVANDQEHERHDIDIRVGERALREIYLPPFEAAVAAGVRSVMGAYNFVNGDHACAHEELLNRVLKDEWGFDGFVVTDWGALKETVAPAAHGCDLEMPGPGRFWGGDQLVDAVHRGDLTEAVIDDHVGRILTFLDWCGQLDQPVGDDEQLVDTDEQRALARRLAVESIVLLRNEGGLLPLDPSALSSLAVIGPNAADTAVNGGGSAMVSAYREESVLDALTARMAEDVSIRHEPGCSLKRGVAPIEDSHLAPGRFTIEIYDGPEPVGEPTIVKTDQGSLTVLFPDDLPAGPELSVVARGTLVVPVTGVWRLAGGGLGPTRLAIDGEPATDNDGPGAYAAGLGNRTNHVDRFLEEGQEVELRLDYGGGNFGMTFAFFNVAAERLGADPEADADAMVDRAVEAAREAEVTVLVVGSNHEWETEGHDRDDLELPARQPELVERVAAAADKVVVVMNCGAPMTMPWLDDVDAVVQAWYPGQEAGMAITDVLVGDAEPGGRMPTTWPHRIEDTPAFASYPGHDLAMSYDEGVFVGYRWYDHEAIEPLWCFGHGLSYTSFHWGEAEVSGTGTDVTVSIPITNTGNRLGSEVVQCYLAPPSGPVDRPVQELVGYEKLQLESGATGVATTALDRRSFARWDEDDHDWVVDPGDYEIRLAASSRDVRARVTVGVSP